MLSQRLSGVVERELGSSRTAAALVEAFLRRSGAPRALAERLLASARESEWSVRLACALMLENLALREPDAFAFVAENFPCGDDLRPRLERLAHVHAGIAGTSTPAHALRAFLRITRTPCRIALARFLVTPAEVVERILSMVTTTAGVRDIAPGENDGLRDEPEIALRELPPYEREIAERLRRTARVYWVDPRTPVHLHALVEYPIGTVVLVVKPPGSDVEIELKRAGLQGPRPLDICFGRNGNILPPSHHLRGGSSGHLLSWERGAGNLLSRIWRLVHGTSAPIARTLAHTTIMNVPLDGQEVNILRWFDDPNLYRGDFELMRRHMRGSITHMEKLDADPVYRMPIEMTGRFIGNADATQAIQLGNSSLRLDRVALYLGADGPKAYFGRGLERRRWAPAEAYDLAGELFEEVIPGFTPAPRRGSYSAYVAATLRRNRALADRCYLDLVEQLGTMWGTLAGARGGSEGESFVSRNVGLRARFEEGRWRVRLAFMDHDALNLTGLRERNLRPRWRGRAICNDLRHILGSRAGTTPVVGSAPMLARIYRPTAAVRREANRLLRAAAVAAYGKTAAAFATNRHLRALFHRSFVSRYGDFHVVVARFIHRRGSIAAWRRWTARYLRSRGYDKTLADEYVDAIPRWGWVWKRAGFMYR